MICHRQDPDSHPAFLHHPLLGRQAHRRESGRSGIALIGRQPSAVGCQFGEDKLVLTDSQRLTADSRDRKESRMASISDVARKARDQGIEFFLASFVEMTGASKAKLVPAEHLETLATEGAGFAGFAAGELGQGPHDPDIAAIPDLDSLTVLPWRPNVAWM